MRTTEEALKSVPDSFEKEVLTWSENQEQYFNILPSAVPESYLELF